MQEITKKELHIISHSSSAVLLFEMMLQNQKLDQNILTFTILNGSSCLIKHLNKDTTSSENDILCKFVAQYIPSAVDRVSKNY